MLYVAGTGTRKLQIMSMTEKTKVIDTIVNQLDIIGELDAAAGGEGRITVISGMAEGFDAAMAAAAIRAGIPFWAYVPNPGYGQYYWGQNSQTRKNRKVAFDALLAQAEKVEYTNEKLGTNSLYLNGVHMNFLRNQHMVDDATHLFGWVDANGTADGGTADCVRRWNLKRENSGAVYYPPVVPVKHYYENS